MDGMMLTDVFRLTVADVNRPATFTALRRQELLKSCIKTTMLSMAECVVMAATWRHHQECCRSKTDQVMAVLVRFFTVSESHGLGIFLAPLC